MYQNTHADRPKWEQQEKCSRAAVYADTSQLPSEKKKSTQGNGTDTTVGTAEMTSMRGGGSLATDKHGGGQCDDRGWTPRVKA